MSASRKEQDIAAIASRFDGIVWTDVVLCHQAYPTLSKHVLLHAGPPLQDTIPMPIRQAAIEAILFEGLAESHASAAALLDSGEVRLQPAQDHGIVTPLAQVVSASMPLFAVERNGMTCHAPMVESPAPALRFGKPGPCCRAHLQMLSQFGMHVLKPALARQPVSMSGPIRDALMHGEECHALTAQANLSLARQLDTLNARDREVIVANPGFVLPLLMAACALRLKENGQIAAVGGNGRQFGYRLRDSDDWHLMPATPPQGTRFPGQEQTVALGAIGDSAVIDFCGLGAQALAFAPTLAHDWHAFLPADLQAHRSRLLDDQSGTVDPKQLHGDAMPMVNLAILDEAAQVGLIGRGVFRIGSQVS